MSKYGGVKWSLSTGVDSGTFTYIEGSACVMLGSWTLKCYF